MEVTVHIYCSLIFLGSLAFPPRERWKVVMFWIDYLLLSALTVSVVFTWKSVHSNLYHFFLLHSKKCPFLGSGQNCCKYRGVWDAVAMHTANWTLEKPSVSALVPEPTALLPPLIHRNTSL